MKKILLSVAAAVVLAGIVFLVTRNNPDEMALEAELSNQIEFYETADGQFSIQYDESTDRAKLSLNGEQYYLEKSVSDTGTRYESADGNVVFYKTEGQANVEIDDALIFENATTTRRRVEVLKSNKQGDPNANKYDFADGTSSNGVDNDCDDSDDSSRCAPGDPIPGIEIVTESEVDLYNNGSMNETQADSDSSVSSDDRATDYNSSRSNRTTN